MELLSEHTLPRADASALGRFTLEDFESDLMQFEIIEALNNAYKAGKKDMYNNAISYIKDE